MFFPSSVFRRCQTSPVVRLGVHLRCLRTSGNGLPQQYRKTHYETLGLTSTASQAEIKSAYYKLSMKYHPDKNKGAEEKFKDITTAYEVLGNPRMRRLYDRGIISHNDDDDTINQHSGGDTATATSENVMGDHTEATRVSAANYDKWSQQQASQAFNRTQTAKKQRHHFAESKSRNAEDTSAENLIWVIFVLGLFAIGYSQVGSLGSSKKPKEP